MIRIVLTKTQMIMIHIVGCRSCSTVCIAMQCIALLYDSIELLT